MTGFHADVNLPSNQGLVVCQCSSWDLCPLADSCSPCSSLQGGQTRRGESPSLCKWPSLCCQVGRVFAFQSVAMTLGLLCWPVIFNPPLPPIWFPYILECLILTQALSMIYMATAQVLPEAVYLVKFFFSFPCLFVWLAIFLHTHHTLGLSLQV